MLLKIWKRRKAIYAALFVFLLMLTAPASLFTSLLQMVAPQLWLSKPSGSFWRGESAQAVISADGGSVVLGKFIWDLQVLSLFTLSPAINIATELSGQSIELTAKAYPTGTLRLTGVKGELPLSIIEPWAPLLVSGHVFFEFPELVFNQEHIQQLQGQVNLRDIVWLGGDVAMPLGHYQANAKMLDEQVNIKLSDQNASLGLNGTVSAMLNGNYHMDMRLSQNNGLNPAIIKSLAWFGKQQGSDVVIQRKGVWR